MIIQTLEYDEWVIRYIPALEKLGHVGRINMGDALAYYNTGFTPEQAAEACITLSKL